MLAKLKLIPLLATITLAAVHTVDVGQGGLTFTPNTVNAVAGDSVVFTFDAGNHTATQSSFDSPCSPLGGGFDSGFKPVPTATGAEKPTYTYNVADASKPVWVYCAQGTHCRSGMVFAINAPTTGNTYDAFKAKAAASGGSSTTTTSTTSGPTPTGSTHKITVGPALTYTPSNITAAAGDVVIFEFVAGGNHTVSQSSFDTPCVLKSGGFDSGFENVPAGGTPLTYNLTVNDTTPIWGFCAQGKHCQNGMVFAINAPTDDPSKSFDKFVQNAKGTATNPTGTNTSPTNTATDGGPSNTGAAVNLREQQLSLVSRSFGGVVLGLIGVLVV